MKAIKKAIASVLFVLIILTSFPLNVFANTVDKSGSHEYSDTQKIDYTYNASTDTLYVNGENLYLYSYGQIPQIDFSFSHLIIGKDIKTIDYYDSPIIFKASYVKDNYYYKNFSFDISCEEDSQLETIAESTFEDASVTTVDLSNAKQLVTIGRFAFQFSDVERVQLPASIKTIAEQAFDNTHNIKEFIIDENVENLTLGRSCFQNSSLPEFISPAGLVEIGETAFWNCRNLEKVTFLTRETENGLLGLKKTGNDSFKNSAVKELVFPETAESLAGFTDMPKLTKVDFSKLKISTLPYMRNNVSLKQVIFPECEFAVPSFEGCTSLEEIMIPDNAVSYESFVNCSNLKYVRLPNSITTLKGFKNCVNLEKVDFPDTIKTVESYAFQNCEKLVMTMLPDTVTKVEYAAFQNCENISFEIPEMIKWIENYAFANSGVTKAVFKLSSYVYIGLYAFYECKDLNEVVFPAKFQYEFSNWDADTLGQYTFYGCENLEKITFTEGCTLATIENSAFEGCSALKEITLPSKLKTLKDRAFKNCSSLKNINLNDTAVTNIYPEAFSGCDFEELSFSNITSIGACAFYNNRNLHKVEFSDNVSTAGSKAFFGCPVNDITIYNPTFKDDFSNIYDNAQSITAYTNSTSHKYAVKNNINFTSLGEYEPLEENVEITCPSSGDDWYISENNELVIGGTTRTSISGTTKLVSDGVSYSINDITTQYGVDTIIIGEGIKSIGTYFLQDVKCVTSIQLPSTLTTIGSYAFYHGNLKSVTIPDGVTEIGKYAFCGCSLEDGIIFSDNIQNISIGEKAFYRCQLDSLDLPNAAISIGTYAFCENYRLMRVYIPENASITKTSFGCNSYGQMLDDFELIVEFGSKAYETCVKYQINYRLNIEGDYISGYVEKVNFAKWLYYPESKELYYYANDFMILDYNEDGKPTYFYDNGKAVSKNELDIDKLYIVEGTTSLNQGISRPLFADLNPKEIILPNTLEHIGKDTFAGLDRVKSLTIPDSVTEIKAGAFDNSKSLEAVYFGKGLTDIEPNLLKDNKYIKYIQLPSALETIGKNAFQSCTGLEEIVIPSTVTTIGENAFNRCLNVRTVTIGSGIQDIGSDAFANLAFCDTVKISSSNMTYGDNPENIFKNLGSSTTGIELSYTGNCTTADLTMFNTQNIVEINFGAKVTNIKNKKSLPKLRCFNVDKNNTSLLSYEGCLYTQTGNQLKLQLAPTAINEVTLNDNTVEICSGAFYGSNIEHISMPDSITIIGTEAFKDCKQLRKATMSSNLERIQTGAFENCTKLKIVDIPSIKYIHNNAFKNCTNLVSILFKNNLQSIGSNAFDGCTSLVSIVIPQNLKTLCGGTFANCTALENVYMLNTTFNATDFENSDNVKINTIASSEAYVLARQYNIPCVTYTNKNIYDEQCAMMENILEGYIGFCSDGHGDIEYLTVYEPTCEQDGYIIGVCEYCSVILEEKHIEATGHSYKKTVSIEPTQTTSGVEKYICTNCNDSYCEYTPALDSAAEKTFCQITGNVVIANDKTAQNGTTPLSGVNIKIDNETVAVTDDNGEFSFSIESGVYELVINYTYGFDRTIHVVANTEDLNVGAVPLIACDWNKDGKIDNNDLNLFRLVISSKIDDAAYLNFVDMNNDGTIDIRDLIYMNNVNGIDSENFTYPTIVINNKI